MCIGVWGTSYFGVLLTSTTGTDNQSLTLLSRGSETARAVRYALGAWPALLVYCGDGAIEIDNNAVEREIRAVALGRKNYLFAGSDAGGRSAAAPLRPDRHGEAERR